MKPPQFFITLILSSICVLLSLLTIWQGTSLTKQSSDFETQKAGVSSTIQKDQAEINAGNQYSQILFRFAQEIFAASTDPKTGVTKDDKLKDLLKLDGIQINLPQASASPSASSTPTH